VFAFEYLNVGFLDLADDLLLGAVDFDEVLEAFALWGVVADSSSLLLVSAISFRFGGIASQFTRREWDIRLEKEHEERLNEFSERR
jgi:hypothetical protein